MRSLRASTGILLVLVACVMAGNGLVVPVLPLYGSEVSSSATLVGMLITVFGVARLAANFPAGALFRRVGSRRLLVVGSVLLMVGAIGAALCGRDLVALLGWRAVQGIGSGVFLTTVGVLVALRTEPGRRGRLLARYQTAVFIGAGVGPTIGGALAQWWGVGAPFWAYALAAAAALAAALLYEHPTSEAVHDPGAAGEPARLRTTMRQPQYLSNLVMTFSNGFVRTAALWQIIPLIAADRFGMDFDLVGIAVTVTSLANLAVLPLSGRLIDRLGWRVPPYIAAFVMAASLALVALSGSVPGFWIGIALVGAAGGFIGPALATSMVEITPTAVLGSATGLQRTVGDVGFVAGPVVVGMLADLGGLDPAATMLLVATLVAASGALWLAVVHLRPRAMVPVGDGAGGDVMSTGATR
ncbi:MAG: MFS transporter [Microbacteriaceae bacterium]